MTPEEIVRQYQIQSLLTLKVETESDLSAAISKLVSTKDDKSRAEAQGEVNGYMRALDRINEALARHGEQ